MAANIQLPAEGLFVVVACAVVYALICGLILYQFSVWKVAAPSEGDGPLARMAKSQHFWMRAVFLVMAAVIGGLMIESSCHSDTNNKCANWHLMYWYGLVLIVTANVSTKPFEFYLGEGINWVDHMKFYLFGTKRPTQEELEQATIVRLQTDSEDAKSKVTFWTLMPSAFITWIFAKSIRNSAWLGGRYGILGGIAYTSWYLSFFTTAFVCYYLRKNYKFKSLPTAVFKNYGAAAVIAFQIAVFFRLFNEVWSNAGVIGSFYGPKGSLEYWGACWLSVLIPTVYVVMGGMRASLFSDVFQAWFAIAFLVVVGAVIGSDKTFSSNTDAFSFSPTTLYKTGGWDDGWYVCFFGGVVQALISYPFFDPVLTDRAFLGTPRTMVLSLCVGGGLAMLFIMFYSVIGVYGAFYKEYYVRECGCDTDTWVKGLMPSTNCPEDWDPCVLMKTTGEASMVAELLGRTTFKAVDTFMAFIMITASMSTLDSTFTSAAKLISLEFGGWLKLEGDNRPYSGPLRPSDLAHVGQNHMTLARAVMIALAFAGTAFLGIEGDVMKATTAAGTCVMGIGAPIWFMTIWRVKTDSRKGWHQAPLAFLVPFAVGIFFGLSYWANGRDKGGWTYDMKVGTFYYSRFFGTNLYGHLICVALFFLFFGIHQLEFVAKYFPEVTLDSDDVVIKSQETDKMKAVDPEETKANI